MDKSLPFVVTINREAGSGGRTIGRKLAEKLGVNFYDKAVITKLVEEYDLSPAQIEKIKAERTGFWAEISSKILPSPNFGYKDDYGKVTSADLFKTESALIKGIAGDRSCVIAGRSAFFVLKNHPNKVSVFVRASLEHRIKRIATKQNLSESEAREIIERIDSRRESYTKEYSGVSRYDSRNYDLVINTDLVDEDTAVKCILDYMGI